LVESAAVEETGTLSLAAVEGIGTSSLAAVGSAELEHLTMHQVDSPREKKGRRGIVMHLQGAARILSTGQPTSSTARDHRAATDMIEAIDRHDERDNSTEVIGRRDERANSIEVTDLHDERGSLMPHARSHITEPTSPTTSTYTSTVLVLDLKAKHLARVIKREVPNIPSGQSVYSTKERNQPHTHTANDSRATQQRAQAVIRESLTADQTHCPTPQQLPSSYMDILALSLP
jgi:hypothetical protein